MIVGNRSLTIIFMTLFVFVLTCNIALWSSSEVYADTYIEPTFTFWSWHLAATNYEFKGFHWFFERISTFPGIQNTVNMTNTWSNIIGNYKITGNWGLDYILAVFRVISTPLLLAVTIAQDLFNSILWFFNTFFVF